MVKKVTDKNTKKDILSAYDEALLEIKNLKANRVDRRADVVSQRNIDNVHEASGTSAEDIVKNLADLRLNANSVISTLEEDILGAKSKLESINNAIKVQEGELKTIHQITREADTLAALIEAHESESREFEEMKENSRLLWRREVEEHEELVKVRQYQMKKEQTKIESEFEYAFDLKKARLQDEFNDERSAFEREMKFRNEDADRQFQLREKTLLEREGELVALRKKVEEIPTLMAEVKEQGIVEGKKKADASNAFAVRALEQKLETASTVSTNEVEMLRQKVDSYVEENKLLREQLNQANAKVQAVAEKAIEGAQTRFYQQPQAVNAGK